MSTYDAVIVGSGINSLVCAAVLARRGKRVCVLERSSTLGGCIRTEVLNAPGFLHDTLATAHPLFVTSPGYAELKEDLHHAGLSYGNNDTPTGVLLPDNRSLILSTSRERNVREAAVTPSRTHSSSGMSFSRPKITAAVIASPAPVGSSI